MKRLLLDQGLPARAAEALRDQGWDVVHVREIGMHASANQNVYNSVPAGGSTGPPAGTGSASPAGSGFNCR